MLLRLSEDTTSSSSKRLKFHNIFQSGMVLQVQIGIFSRTKVSDLEDGVLQAGVRARVWGAGQVHPDATVLTLQCRGASRKVFL